MCAGTLCGGGHRQREAAAVVVGGGGGGAWVAGYDGLDYDGYAAMQGRRYVGEWLLTLTLTRVRRAAVAVLLQGGGGECGECGCEGGGGGIKGEGGSDGGGG